MSSIIKKIIILQAQLIYRIIPIKDLRHNNALPTTPHSLVTRPKPNMKHSVLRFPNNFAHKIKKEMYTKSIGVSFQYVYITKFVFNGILLRFSKKEKHRNLTLKYLFYFQCYSL